MGMLDRFRRNATPYMTGTHFGPIHNVTDYALRTAPEQPDRIGWAAPASFGRAWAGAQMHNGVSQLDSGWQVQTAGDVPYWLTQSRMNPPQSTRYGGPGRQPMGPVQVKQFTDAAGQGKPLMAGGFGTLYTPGD